MLTTSSLLTTELSAQHLGGAFEVEAQEPFKFLLSDLWSPRNRLMFRASAILDIEGVALEGHVCFCSRFCHPGNRISEPDPCVSMRAALGVRFGSSEAACDPVWVGVIFSL